MTDRIRRCGTLCPEDPEEIRILAASDEEILAEMTAEGKDPKALAEHLKNALLDVLFRHERRGKLPN